MGKIEVGQNCTPPRRKKICPGKTFIAFEKSEIEQSVIDRFERQVSAYPFRTAVETDKERLTYSEINRAANRTARDMAERFGQDNIPAALFLDQGARLITAILAALKAGKCYVALDTSFPPSKNVSLVKHSRPGLVLTDRDHYPLARKLFENTAPLMVMEEVSPLHSSANLGLPVSKEAAAYIIYTSGSTGEPKGVVQDHQNVLHNVMRCTNMLHIASDDRLSLLWSCSFAASIPNIFGALLNGAALLPYDIKKNGIADLADWLIRKEITIYHSVPTVYRHLLSTLTGKENFSVLRLIKLSGEPVLKTDVESYKRHFSENCIFHVSYASTETNIVRQFFCGHHTELSGDIVPVGYEVEDMEVLILDETGENALAGSPGEIAVASPYLPSDYYERKASTPPFQPYGKGKNANQKSRIYKTGDIGYMLPDGCLVHLGRKDRQIKIRGYRVETGEIETALGELPAIKEAAVTGIDDPHGGKSLAAYVVTRAGREVTPGELRNFLKNRLPDYMVPSRFVFLDALPLTLSGKVDRGALPSAGAKRHGFKNETEKDYVPPGTPEEAMLARIWCGLLGINHAGVSDNFFDLGGHSLLVAQMAAEIKKATGKTLSVASIFQSTTISQLAKIIREGEPIPKFPSMLSLSDGPGLPLFWIGFNAFLPRYLDNRPVYEVLIQGDYKEDTSYSRIEQLAVHHLREILAVRPKGPYLLGGYCFWGLVAFEMALQLFGRGEEVPLLCLVEPPPQCLPPSGRGIASPSPAVRPKSVIELTFSKQPAMRDAGLASIIRRKIGIHVTKARCRGYLLLGKSIPTGLRTFHQIQTARKYAPRAYPGKCAVFLGENGDAGQQDWRRLAGEHVHEIPGANHLDMRDGPAYVAIWAKQLNGYLKEIDYPGGNETGRVHVSAMDLR